MKILEGHTGRSGLTGLSGRLHNVQLVQVDQIVQIVHYVPFLFCTMPLDKRFLYRYNVLVTRGAGNCRLKKQECLLLSPDPDNTGGGSVKERDVSPGVQITFFGDTMKHPRRRIISTFLGNIFEHYDTALFAMLSPFLAPLFFPDQSPTVALILIYGMMPLGMLAKPIGSLLFGYLGDIFGRETALFWSFSGTAAVTASIAFLPTHSSIGFMAPLLLSIGKMMQVFFSAGESSGGGIYLLEHTNKSNEDVVSSFYGASTILGVLIASAAVSLLSYMNWMEMGWRVLYLIGSAVAIFGWFLRKQQLKTPMPTTTSPRPTFTEHIKSCWQQRQMLLPIILASAFTYTTWSISLILMNGFIPLITNVTRAEMMQLNTFLLLIDCLSSPLFGLLAQRYSRERMMFLATLCATTTGLPLIHLLDGATFMTVVVIRLILVLTGVWFSSTYYSWCQNLIPLKQRYTTISFGYAIGSQLIGSPAAAISLWLYHQTGIPAIAGLYWVVLAFTTSIVMYTARARIPIQA